MLPHPLSSCPSPRDFATLSLSFPQENKTGPVVVVRGQREDVFKMLERAVHAAGAQ